MTLTHTERLLKHFDKSEESDYPDQHCVHYEPNSRDFAVILTVEGMFNLVETVMLNFDKEEGIMYIVFNCVDREDAITFPESDLDGSDFAVFKRTKS